MYCLEIAVPEQRPADWSANLDRMAGRFTRVETRRRARKFLFGLLADLPRKNGWVRHEAPSDRVGVRRPPPLGRRSDLVKLGAA